MKKTVLALAMSMTVMTALTGCIFDNSSGTTVTAPPAATPPPATPVPSNITNPSGAYTISVFATNPAGSSKPDDIVPVQTAANSADSAVFIAYQDRNVVDPMGNVPTGAPSGAIAQGQIVEYGLTGNILQTINIPGHIDGMLQNTVSDYHTLWVTSDEDANPKLSVINFSTNPATVVTYTADAASVSAVTVTDPNNTSITTNVPLQHGGGLDDMKLIGTNIYVSASAPATTMTPANPSTTLPYSTSWINGASCGLGTCGNGTVYGINQAVSGSTNTNAAIQYQITLNSGASNTYHVTPVVTTDGSTTPTTMLSNGITALTSNNGAILNATDSDSTAIDPNGDLWIDSQQDGELIHVSSINPANSTQTTSVLPLTYGGTSWSIDDFRWVPPTPTGVTGKTFMLVTDTGGGYVYRVDANSSFAAGQVFAAAGNMITSVNMTTGALTPVFINFQSTHGLNFIVP
ncbi:MAG: hypothetical protein ACYCSZ_03200 [Burkholderiales bacterium]